MMTANRTMENGSNETEKMKSVCDSGIYATRRDVVELVLDAACTTT
jgi:hypothetical protein